jgi:phosphatidylserine/phosphatidylglycerophosphate/cardiolipin synthase-like enzyme
MPSPPLPLLEAIATLTEALPERAIGPLAEAIVDVPPGSWPALHAVATQVLAAPHYREQVGALLATWQAQSPTVAPATVALALQAAATAVSRQRRAQTIELVWTGPASRQPLRRTAQVLQSVIDEAQRELLIVSFAVYDIPEIGAALLRAAERGVTIRLVIESPQASAGKVAYDGLAAFGPQVASHAEVYGWPIEQRPRDDEGRHGSLHAKCAVADRQLLLISSANLTHYALTLNMELGLLIRGGPQPREVDRHFQALIDRGALSLLARQTATRSTI